ncbi:MAG: LysM peptidoglycan-binding domain-containing protein [Bdellovibrionales bacterium]
MKRAALIAVLASLIFEVALGLDQPNLELEERFHKIFKDYNEVPVTEEQWGRAYSITQPQNYDVMEQDTLWDISKVLFADPFFWPKIWSFNTDILNPHEIKPGWIIKFIPGTLQTPPAITVSEYEGVALPPPKPSRPIADLPPSLPDYRPEIPDFRPPAIMKLDRLEVTKVPPLVLPAELMSKKPEPVGEVVEIEDGGRLVTDNHELYVRLTSGLKSGSYSVIRFGEKNSRGIIIQYRGEILVQDRINDSENIHRAIPRKMIDSFEVGDLLLPGPIPVVNVEEVPVAGSGPLSFRIVGGIRSPTDLYYAPFSIVFIDGGTRQGLSEGDALFLYQYPKLRNKNSRIKRSYRKLGVIRLVRVYDSVATAYILNSTMEVRDGDIAGILETRPDSGSSPEPTEEELTLE